MSNTLQTQGVSLQLIRVLSYELLHHYFSLFIPESSNLAKQRSQLVCNDKQNNVAKLQF